MRKAFTLCDGLREKNDQPSFISPKFGVIMREPKMKKAAFLFESGLYFLLLQLKCFDRLGQPVGYFLHSAHSFHRNIFALCFIKLNQRSGLVFVNRNSVFDN